MLLLAVGHLELHVRELLLAPGRLRQQVNDRQVALASLRRDACAGPPEAEERLIEHVGPWILMLPLKIRLSAGAISVICLKIDRPPPEFVRPLASVPGHRRFEGDEAPVAAQPIWISHNSQKHGEIRLGKVLIAPHKTRSWSFPVGCTIKLRKVRARYVKLFTALNSILYNYYRRLMMTDYYESSETLAETGDR